MPPTDELNPDATEDTDEAPAPVAVPAAAADDEPLGDDVDELLSAGAMRARGEDADADDREPDDGDEPEDIDLGEADDGEAGEDGDEPARSPAPSGQFDQLVAEERYAEALLLAPERHSNIPARERGKAIREALDLRSRQVAQDVAMLAIQQRREERELEVFVREKDDLRRDDPEAFADWQEEHEDEADRYLAGRRFFKALNTENPLPLPAAAKNAAESQQDAKRIQEGVNTRLVPRFRDLPEAVRGEITERARAGEFPLTDEGYTALERAIDNAYASLANGRAKPASERTQSRKVAAERRRSAPRPVGSNGNGVAKPNPLEDVIDTDELFAMSANAAAARRAR
ncbi:MAG: hypothetical protein NUW01_05990 [Gemmatimonadaceae bacterium]|nr:hypothetical protein [Gemmatimonadaceae bacterium]